MPRKKIKPEAIEQKSFIQFNPRDIKQAVEIPVKPKPSLEELEKIEFLSNMEKGKGRRKRKEKKEKDRLVIYACKYPGNLPATKWLRM